MITRFPYGAAREMRVRIDGLQRQHDERKRTALEG